MRGPHDPSLALLGEGWFPDSPGGAARVVRELHQALRPLVDVRTVVVGPVTRPVDGVRAAGTADEPLLRRLRATARAAAEEAHSADVVEAHFALYAWLPLLTRRFRGNVFIAHFH